MEKVLVAGATGTTGKQIIELLNNSGRYSPIAMVRKEEQRDDFESKGIKTVMGDLEKDVSHTTEHVDKVIFAAGSGGKKVVEVDQEGAKRLIDASKKHNVKKFVMLSSMGADEPSAHEELQEYLKAKQEADEYLRASTLKYTIVRPGALNNENGQGNIQLKQKFDEQGEIPREDVASTLVHCMEDSIAPQKTFEILSGTVPIPNALLTV